MLRSRADSRPAGVVTTVTATHARHAFSGCRHKHAASIRETGNRGDDDSSGWSAISATVVRLTVFIAPRPCQWSCRRHKVGMQVSASRTRPSTAPRQASMTAPSRAASAPEPLHLTRPDSMTAIRSAVRRTCSVLCSTVAVVTPAFRGAGTMRQHSSMAMDMRRSESSSIIWIAEFGIMAQPNASTCLLPSDSGPASCRAQTTSRGNVSKTLERIVCHPGVVEPGPDDLEFSSTERSAMTRQPSGTRAMPLKIGACSK